MQSLASFLLEDTKILEKNDSACIWENFYTGDSERSKQ